uniref:Uncharacterized protein n=1 Tax=Strigamia maritima TaxID=126957 RepID=T1JCK1_STRMM
MYFSKVTLLLIGLLCLLQIENGLSLKCYECEEEENCKGKEKDCETPESGKDQFCTKIDGTYVISGKSLSLKCYDCFSTKNCKMNPKDCPSSVTFCLKVQGEMDKKRRMLF